MRIPEAPPLYVFFTTGLFAGVVGGLTNFWLTLILCGIITAGLYLFQYSRMEKH